MFDGVAEGVGGGGVGAAGEGDGEGEGRVGAGAAEGRQVEDVESACVGDGLPAEE